MSRDPERLLSASSAADPLERELLDSVRHVGPPGDAQDKAWRAIVGQIAVVTAVGTAATSTAAAASKAGAGTFATWALSTKVAVVALTGGLAVGAGILTVRSPEAPARSVPAPVASAAASVRVAAPVSLPPIPLVSPTESGPIEDAPSRRPEPRRLDSLKAESALLTQARAQLRSGNPAGAQASLDRLHAQFPNGILAQEREVLAIEVLHARGSVDGAKRRAKAFIKAHPKSPHSEKLARFVE